MFNKNLEQATIHIWSQDFHCTRETGALDTVDLLPDVISTTGLTKIKHGQILLLYERLAAPVPLSSQPNLRSKVSSVAMRRLIRALQMAEIGQSVFILCKGGEALSVFLANGSNYK